MAVTNLTPEQQVALASQPMIDYMQTPEYRNEVIADNNRIAMALNAQGEKGWEKGAVGLPVPELQQPVVNQLPTIITQAEPDPAPIARAIQAQPQQQLRTLTPCDLGMCDGLSYGTNGQLTVATSAPSGKMMMNSGHAGGRNLLGQLLLAGELERLQATPETIEKNNMRTEIGDLNNMRRTPEWQTNYNSLVAQGVDRLVAGAQADRLTGTQFGGQIDSITSRYADPINQQRVQAVTDQNVGRLASQGAFDQIGLGNGSVAGGYQVPAPESITLGADGNYQTTSTINGQQVQSAPTTPDRLLNTVQGLTSPNTTTSTVNVLTNASNVAQQQLQQAQNENAYNQFNAGLKVEQALNTLANNDQRNQIAQERLELQQQNALARGTTSGSGSTTRDVPLGTVPTVYSKPPSTKAPSKVEQEFNAAKTNALKQRGQEADGGYSQAILDTMQPRTRVGAQAFNDSIRINRADPTIWNSPESVATNLQKVELGILHAQRVKQFLEQTNFKQGDENRNRIAHQEMNNKLTELLQFKAELMKQYERYRSQSGAGIAVGR